MTIAKIEITELDELLAEGKSVKEIADHFGCTPGAVSQAKRRLGTAVAKDAATRAAPALLSKRQDAMDHLLDLVDRCKRELDWIEKTVPPANDEGYRQWQEMKIKHAAEIRKLITAMADIRYKIYHAETVEKALRVILEEIGNESPECQKKIRDRLRECSIHI